MNDILSVHHLRVAAGPEQEKEILVADASFTVGEGEAVVLLGESGSGKTVLSRALTRLFPRENRIQLEGSVMFRGRPVLSMVDEQLALLRRKEVRYVFQDPVSALNPVATVRSQMLLAAGGALPGADAVTEGLARAGISDPRGLLHFYPHQLSVGLAQRVAIAMALLPSPSLLIADEPTSAVDVHLRFQILDLLMGEHRGRGMSLLLITHDLEAAQLHAGRILVMYRGRIIESGPADEFFSLPLHPYSRMLLDAHALGGERAKETSGPDGTHEPPTTGCRFSHRCPRVRDRCIATEPMLEPGPKGRAVRCHFWK